MLGITAIAVGDSAIKVNFAGKVSYELNAAIQMYSKKLEEASIPGVVEWVPAFNSVTVYYQPKQVSFHILIKKLYDLHEVPISSEKIKSRIIQVPVLYGGEYAPDLQRVAEHSQLEINEVIDIHQNQEYLIYMIGFLPGFPYLAGLDKRIATPRLEEPRGKIYAGAVGIANEQTGIYPVESPGGWNIIGKTPLRLFDRTEFLFQTGDYVKFHRVNKDKFLELESQIKNNRFKVSIVER